MINNLQIMSLLEIKILPKVKKKYICFYLYSIVTSEIFNKTCLLTPKRIQSEN